MLRNQDVLDGKYQVIREIGKGGTGIVYLGYHLTLCKYVVIKKIKDHFVGNINARGEVDILKKLHHRYLPQVYDFLVIGTGVYTIMDFVDGHDLDWYAENGYVFTEDQMRRMLCQLCEVLQYLHSQKPPVIHSDIKPGNIMLRSDGDVCLIDFNISLDGEEQTVLGYSAYFAAPEQMELSQAILYGKNHAHLKLDARTDLYSLGATFYYLMTGIMPTDRANFVPAQKLSLVYSREFSRVIDKAMEVSRMRRYPSADKMLAELQHGNIRQRRLLIGALAVLLVLLAAGGVVAGSYQVTRNRQQKFLAAFSEFQSQQDSGDTGRMRETGMSILNEEQYAGQLRKHAGQKASILGGIADSYYQEGNYKAAVAFYEEALEAAGKESQEEEYLRDYILSLSKGGEADKAERELRQAQNRFSSDSFTYLQAEFLLEKGDTQEALPLLQQVLAQSSDRKLKFRCGLQAAACLKGTDRAGEQLQLLSAAEETADSPTAYRQLAEAYADIGQSCQDRTLEAEALAAAENCYLFLNRQQTVSYLDRLNYATVKEMQGDYRKAFELLQKLEQDYPEDYRTYRQEAFLCYRTEMAKEAQKRDFQGVLYYGRMAAERCNATQAQEERMVQLQELMRQLSE